ncbi:hypothetical protein KL86APRO_30070 [uncultured Alphaproteobacteria bacterium]|uniref:Uncharacterized protein n=1 Tax=uncultured Alphaproteobacteria bacterium TaxID=91750 RepID=A0A212KLK1_9PROT|nr:hypothetical protein KL86APRO_30070 [uncultured Alphaproteobacteria bacterium]
MLLVCRPPYLPYSARPNFPEVRNAHAKTAARSLAPPFSGDSTRQSVTS